MRETAPFYIRIYIFIHVPVIPLFYIAFLASMYQVPVDANAVASSPMATTIT
jgi:hypothetical protein